MLCFHIIMTLSLYSDHKWELVAGNSLPECQYKTLLPAFQFMIYIKVPPVCRLLVRGAYRSWKVVEIKILIFQGCRQRCVHVQLIYLFVSQRFYFYGWAPECPDVKNCKWRLNPAWCRMLYSCTHMTTVGIIGLSCQLLIMMQMDVLDAETVTSWRCISCLIMEISCWIMSLASRLRVLVICHCLVSVIFHCVIFCSSELLIRC